MGTFTSSSTLDVFGFGYKVQRQVQKIDDLLIWIDKNICFFEEEILPMLQFIKTVTDEV
jgi:hypothetical protein